MNSVGGVATKDDFPHDITESVVEQLGISGDREATVRRSSHNLSNPDSHSNRGYQNELECAQLIETLAAFKPALRVRKSARPKIDKIRDYKLIEVIGEGGMGIVYRARHTRLQRDVALKLLSGKLSSTPKAIRRFEREMKVYRNLDHPNITVCDWSQHSGIV